MSEAKEIAMVATLHDFGEEVARLRSQLANKTQLFEAEQQESAKLTAEVARLRADSVFLADLYNMAADLRFSSEFIGIFLRNHCLVSRHEQAATDKPQTDNYQGDDRYTK